MALAILVGLGVWQVRRLDWKTRLLAEIAERTTATPQPLPPESQWASLRHDDYAYRHVTLTGTFLHEDEVHVFRPLSPETAKGRTSGLGDLVLTPLRLPDGVIVIVNRGFVPQENVDPASRPAGQAKGLVTVTGLMREPESRNLFTPADDPKGGTWFTRDPAAIGSYFRLDRVAPFTVDADASGVPGDLPQGGETLLDIPNNHLSYAMTWFGLAVGLCLVFVAFIWKRLFEHANASLPAGLKRL
ncbi:SURF1 family protein [Lichenifustis flavocetrariae]|uniref:SURF1-like protein n=1 Tax=Lichenifustis flavocetrariae TaxID=2949735 RepID=A0AA42CLQ6_9HYPH|nr:SURF1 family protein [Lichenifustis flavocetrariae]MCW6510681.1 SURF1 family protein [Lichenifustis flavocetrariae]